MICSDGISDQCTQQEMEETFGYFYKSQDTENCCKRLVDSATEKWHHKHSMQDDITAIVIFLRWKNLSVSNIEEIYRHRIIFLYNHKTM